MRHALVVNACVGMAADSRSTKCVDSDVAGAIEGFKAAGPYAGERADATQRTALLALVLREGGNGHDGAQAQAKQQCQKQSWLPHSFFSSS